MRATVGLLLCSLLLWVPTKAASAGGSAQGEAMANEAVGTWLVMLDSDIRTRTLDFRSVIYEAGRMKADIAYGMTGKELFPTTAELSVVGGAIRLEFFSSAKSKLIVEQRGDRMTGTITFTNGEVHALVLTRAGAEELKDNRVVARRNSDIRLIYISASNCSYCTWWESHDRRDFVNSPVSKQVPLQEVQCYSYSATNDDACWPAELRWVRTKTFVGSGTPRFLVLMDRTVVMNKSGIYNWQTKVLPFLQRLIAQKAAA